MAIKNTAGTCVANLEPNRVNGNKIKSLLTKLGNQ
jgi:hypothetical protein